MTVAQKHIIEKMATVHKVKIYGSGNKKDSLIVFSYIEKKKQYLSYRIGWKGTADLLSVIKGNKFVDNKFKKMLTIQEWN
jgi:hypothetical protein